MVYSSHWTLKLHILCSKQGRQIHRQYVSWLRRPLSVRSHYARNYGYASTKVRSWKSPDGLTKIKLCLFRLVYQCLISTTCFRNTISQLWLLLKITWGSAVELSVDATSGAVLELPKENLPKEIWPIAEVVKRFDREHEWEGWPGWDGSEEAASADPNLKYNSYFNITIASS